MISRFVKIGNYSELIVLNISNKNKVEVEFLQFF